MDRNVVGDSSGMSKATRLQKSRLTKELICELTRTQERNQSEALEQVNEHERLGGGGQYPQRTPPLVLLHAKKCARRDSVCFCARLC